MPSGDDDRYFTPDPAPRRGRSDYDPIIQRHATRTGLDPTLIRAVMGQESSGNPTATSPKGARGLMQLMPATAQRFGVRDVSDPEENIRGGTDYLRFLHDRYKGDTDKVLAAYNSGEGNVDKYGGIPPFRETRNYVPAVKARMARLTGQSQNPDSRYITQEPDDKYFTPDKVESKPVSRPKPRIAGPTNDFLGPQDMATPRRKQPQTPPRLPPITLASLAGVGELPENVPQALSEAGRRAPKSQPVRVRPPSQNLRQLDDPETSRILRIEREVREQQTPDERAAKMAPGASTARLLDPKLGEQEEIVRRASEEKAQDDEIQRLAARRPEIDALKAKFRGFGEGEDKQRAIQSVFGSLAGSGVQAGNLISMVTGGRRGQGLTDQMRLAQIALSEIEHEDPNKGWLAAAERTLPGAGVELAKMYTLSRVPVAGRATLPGLGALSEADKGLAAATRGGVEGELFHRGFEAVQPLSKVKRFAAGTSVPAALAIAQGEDPKKAILSNTAFGAMAVVGPGEKRGINSETTRRALDESSTTRTELPSDHPAGSGGVNETFPRTEGASIPQRVSGAAEVSQIRGAESEAGRMGEGRQAAREDSAYLAPEATQSVETVHHSASQNRRVRNTESGKRGQFKPGKVETETAGEDKYFTPEPLQSGGRFHQGRTDDILKSGEINPAGAGGPNFSLDEPYAAPKTDSIVFRHEGPVGARVREDYVGRQIEGSNRPIRLADPKVDIFYRQKETGRLVSVKDAYEAGTRTEQELIGVGKDRVDAPPESVSEAPKVPPVTTPEIPQATPKSAQGAAEPLAASIPESVTSARKSQLAADRAELDLPELPAPERKGWQVSLDNAKEKGLDRQADSLAEAINKKPRALNDEETAGLVLRAQELKNEHSRLMNEISGELSPEALAEKRAQLETLESQFDKVTEATRKSGTEKGRALASQKLTINQDFDLVSMLNRYKAKTGKEPTPEVRAKIEKLQKTIEEQQAVISAHEATIKANEGFRQIRNEVAREGRKGARQKKAASLEDEFASLKEQFALAKQEIKESPIEYRQGGIGLASLDPSGKLTPIIRAMAKNRVKAGLNTVEAVVEDVYKAVKEHIEGITKRDIRDAISGYAQPTERQSALQRELNALKTEMRNLSSQEDVEAGKRSVRGEGPRPSEARRLPMEGPRVSDARRVPAPGPRMSEARSSGVPLQGPKLSDIRRVPEQGPSLSEGVGRTEGPRMGEARRLPAEGPKLGEAPKQGPRDWLPAAKKRLQARIDEVQARINAGDFSEKAKRPEIRYDRQGERLRADLERTKQKFEELKAANQKKNLLDYLVKWKRFAVLTYPTTLGKLGMAASGRMIQTPVEEITGGILSKIPGISRIAAKAPREGRFNVEAEVQAIRQLWNSDSFKGMLDQLKMGKDDLDLLYGHKTADKEFLNLPGRSHGAIKEIPKRAEFERAFVKRLRYAARNGQDISDPQVQLGARMEAYVDSQRAILMQPNKMSDAFNRAMNDLQARGGWPGKIAAAAARFEIPITRVPVNYVAEQTSLIPGVGAAKGAFKLAEVAWREGVKNTIKGMKPEEADYILRAWKKQGPGLAMALLGFLRPQNFGGYYQKGKKKDEEGPQTGEVMIMGRRIPRWATHIPMLEVAQFGATTRQVMNKMLEKGESRTGAAVEGGLHAGWELTKEVPFVSQPQRIYGAFDAPNKRASIGKFLGGEARSMVPGAIQQGTQYFDKGPSGRPVKRKSEGFADEFSQGVPGLRQRVSIGPLLGATPTKTSDELTRLGVRLQGATIQPDESAEDYEKRKAWVNPRIRSTIDAEVNGARWDQMSEDMKRERIKKVTEAVGAEYRRQFLRDRNRDKPRDRERVRVRL